jgi:hypothetical protein
VRLAHAKAQGFDIADLSLDTPLHEQIAALLGEFDAGVPKKFVIDPHRTFS